jgi:hypothetical protein
MLIIITPHTEADMHFRPVTDLKKIKRPTTYVVKTDGYEFRVPNPPPKKGGAIELGSSICGRKLSAQILSQSDL